MKAVILAAGVGSRLRPITDAKPKCLVRPAGREILDYQLKAYAAAGVSEVFIVAGYRTDAICDFCADVDDLAVTIVENPEYAETNNMFSLFLAANYVEGEAFFLSNGDVALEESIIVDLAGDGRDDLIAAQKGRHNSESMKIRVDAAGTIVDISKQIGPADAYGSSIDVYKFSPASSATFFAEMRRVIEGEGERNEWTEVAMQGLLNSGAMPMQPFDIGDRRWVEIDTFEDLVAADGIFSSLDLETIKLAFLDLDGTIYLGDGMLPGAMDFLAELKRRGITTYFLSNNSSRSKRDYVAKLARLEIEATTDDILLSTDGLIQHLLDEGVTRTYVVGTHSLREAMREAGIEPESDSPAYVVLGYDTELTYEKLRRAALFMLDGVELLMTHCDVVCPTPDGPIPDAGAMQALLTKATGREPKRIFGKPNAEMVAHVIARHGVAPVEAMMVGDRLYTDMAMAVAAGCRSVLVLTGETKRTDVESADDFPDLVSESAGRIFDA